MAEEGEFKEEFTRETEGPLISDYDRVDKLLSTAQRLALENKGYNPGTIRDFFIALNEFGKFISAMLDDDKREKLRVKAKKLDVVTRKIHFKLLNDPDYVIGLEIFDILDDYHAELLTLKAKLGLGIKVRTKFTPKQRLETSMK